VDSMHRNQPSKSPKDTNSCTTNRYTAEVFHVIQPQIVSRGLSKVGTTLSKEIPLKTTRAETGSHTLSNETYLSQRNSHSQLWRTPIKRLFTQDILCGGISDLLKD